MPSYGPPSAPYNAKPAPIHTGDFDAVGFSTAYLTSAGFAALADGFSGQSAAAAKGAIAFATGPAGSGIVAFAILAGVLLYLDKRIARR